MKIPIFLSLLLIALSPVALGRTTSQGIPSNPQISTSDPEPVTPANLRDHLFSRVQACRSMRDNTAPDDTDGRLKIIDDIANGYLQVSAEWPPCGCRCTVTAAAFKSSDGSYTVVQAEEWGCSWTRRVSAYPPLHVIFPEDLVISAFIPSADITAGGGTACFCLDAELPRIGTDVKLTIRTIPFGMRIDCKGLLAYEYAEAEGASNCRMLFRIREIAERLDDKHLETLVAGRMELLPPEASSVVMSAIGDDPSRFKSGEELSGHLGQLRRIYDLYCRIEHQWVILGWEREKSTFFIRDKGPAVSPPSFREFLLREQFWSPAC